MASENESNNRESAIEFAYAQGIGFLRMKDYDKAAETFEAIIDESVFDPRGYWGMLLVSTRCFTAPSPEADEWYEKALRNSHPAVKNDIKQRFEDYKAKLADDFAVAAKDVTVAETVPEIEIPETDAPEISLESNEAARSEVDYSDFESVLQEQTRKEAAEAERRYQIEDEKRRRAAKKRRDLKKIIIAAAAVILAVILLIVIVRGVSKKGKENEKQDEKIEEVTPPSENTDTKVPETTPEKKTEYDLSELTVKPEKLLDAEETYRVTAEDGLNMRRGPESSHDYILTIPGGTEVKVIAQTGTWKLCVYDDTVGWSSGNYLEKVD